ncbi:MAG: pyruvate dehydrogenase complex dihydrolipoamide acetyltransferase [Proteobacteria bacterium]|nr:pyruvate dehydrogenase complex dihydrolipoamide acetyltransferase [Pseudomonadota bacterium]MDA1058645.1 pyruvate dehydrogenase complex dihydrolipoamide acetyltransferase [Pseudomonadota bacterium]
MPISITMPALSPTMEEGTLAKWLVKEGQAISSGDVIAEIETDKATMEVEAIDDGTVGKLLVAEGTEGVKVNTVIAVLLEEGEDAGALSGFDTGVAAKPAVAPAPVPTPQAEPSAVPAPQAAPAAAPVAEQPVTAPAPRLAAVSGSDRVVASPLARRMAAQSGLDLASMAGSGPGGRIVKADIESALSGGAPVQRAATAAALPQRAAAPIQPGAAYVEVPNNTMRKVIARRLTESKQLVPHFYMTVDCDIDKLMAMRKELNERGAKDAAFKLSVNDFIIRAAALALKKVPSANASWTDAATLRYTSVDISVAVAVANGLITPVVRNADQKGLAEISNEMKDLAGRAHEGKLLPEEYQGGTFSISNLGMYGIKEFAAVINPPQGAILAVGKGEQRPVVKDGALSIATMMSCTLSCDHRVVDGAIGAELLQAFKGFIEDPVTMLL